MAGYKLVVKDWEDSKAEKVRREQPYVQTVGDVEDKRAAAQAASDVQSQQNMAAGIGAAGTMVGQTIDPKAEGAGAALSGAASGAAAGTMIAPGYGTAIGAAIGLGLGVIKGEQNRKQNKANREAEAAKIMAQGLENASKEMLKKQFRFGTSAGTNKTSYSSKRNLS